MSQPVLVKITLYLNFFKIEAGNKKTDNCSALFRVIMHYQMCTKCVYIISSVCVCNNNDTVLSTQRALKLAVTVCIWRCVNYVIKNGSIL